MSSYGLRHKWLLIIFVIALLNALWKVLTWNLLGFLFLPPIIIGLYACIKAFYIKLEITENYIEWGIFKRTRVHFNQIKHVYYGMDVRSFRNSYRSLYFGLRSGFVIMDYINWYPVKKILQELSSKGVRIDQNKKSQKEMAEKILKSQGKL